ncbi:hypothetical protein HQQ88_04890 [Curtobacterium sp. VKM Ac-2861]|uniref:hypothetical protein n=1 Tax=Curtobacterium sp. VKM Ac-2861 TaxID=2739016 RepID=UPI001564D35C|nr:hypothetical protein [Curtobacterium sp. VKM Ac-2861]
MSVAQREATSTTIRVRSPSAVMTAATWLRAHFDESASTWVYVGTRTKWTMSAGVTGLFGTSDAALTTAARLTADHPDMEQLDLGRTLITAITPTRRQAEQVVAAFERTPADGREQEVSAWWPDGNGTKVSGVVGAESAGRGTLSP